MHSTGNDIESNDILDFEDNCENLDVLMNADQDYWTTRLGDKKPTIDYALRMAGFTPAGFDFTTGGVLKNGDRNKCVFNQADQTWYSWSGDLPYNVIAGSVPREGWKVVESNRNKPVRSVSSLTKLKTLNTVVGDIYRTGSYHEGLTYGGALYLVTDDPNLIPDGYGDHQCANGKKLFLLSDPTDINHGVKVNPIYNPVSARSNRNSLQWMFRNTRWNEYVLKAAGTYYLLGSVNIPRDNISVIVNKCCKIIGRYSDSSVPTPDQAGGMLNFAHFFDPDNGDFIPWRDGDKRINKPVENVHVILDGDVSTEFSDSHTNKNNNNVISFAKAVNSSVRGTGGVSGSDHRGINFDGIDTNAPNGSDNTGGSVNCHIDVNYIKNCVNNPAMIYGDKKIASLNTVKIGSIGKMLSGGYNDPIGVNVFDGSEFEIEIGSFIGDNVVKPALVVARRAKSVKVKVGVCNGAKSILYSDLTLDNVLSVEEIYNTPIAVIRAGTEGGKCRSVHVSGIKATDGNFTTPFHSQNNLSPFLRLVIRDNNFYYAPTSFKMFSGKNQAALPAISDITNNILPPVVDNVTEFNMLPSGRTASLVNPGVTTVDIEYRKNDWNYSKLSVIASDQDGVRWEVCMDILSRNITNQAVNYRIGLTDSFVTSNITNNVITLTCTKCTLQIVTLHN